MLIDSHCHITALTPAQEKTISHECAHNYLLIDASIDTQTAKKSLELSQRYPFMYSALGFHPFSVEHYQNETIAHYQNLITQHAKIVAIGEIGLDMQAPFPEKQETILSDFIQLAIANSLPVQIHNRTETTRVFDILDNFFTTYEKVIFHCFSYGPDTLERIAKKNGFISFSLNVLHNKTRITESIKNCPLDLLLLETDSPYMKINRMPSTPAHITDVYAYVSKIKEVPMERLMTTVYANARKAFSI